ncbi:DNA repair protein RadC [Pedobacter steynii]|uniref:DNA repair protein RadC n=1 Tax=Pedobacter steynii TaxID=430522 RepID=A0A1G9K7Q3_9SPHI|nr:UPF0758 domain-containing protein [Pedobacter steynii]NQX38465.1 hypothetical protein [Pedobacter steynii]SDL45405.1 DNA repair protein RadC [Pedobacter steynii]
MVLALNSLVQSAAYLDRKDKTVRELYRENKQQREKGIKSWEPEKRPREKMFDLGTDAMNNAELLAIIIGTGIPDETAVALAERMLNSVDNILHHLSALNYADLCRFKVTGIAKSNSIIAAFEIARRIYSPMRIIKIN